MNAKAWFPSSLLGPGTVGKVATLGAVVASAAVVEAALIPGLLLGGAVVLAPRLLRRGTLSGLAGRLRRAAPSPAPATPMASPEAAAASGELAFDPWRAAVKTITYRLIVTTVDFGANYVVIGELATAAGLSSLSLVAGPIAYFAHEAAWHYYGPASARHANPLEAAVQVPIPGVAGSSVKVSRAVAKTVTYEGVTAVSEFSVNYIFVRDLVAAAGLTAFSIVIAPIVYYVHEKAWDFFEASSARAPASPAMKLLPAA